MEQPVHGGAGEQRIAELLHGAIGRRNHRPALVTHPDDLVDIGRLLEGQRAGAEVVDDEQVDLHEPCQPAAVAAVGAQLLEHVARAHVHAHEVYR